MKLARLFTLSFALLVFPTTALADDAKGSAQKLDEKLQKSTKKDSGKVLEKDLSKVKSLFKGKKKSGHKTKAAK